MVDHMRSLGLHQTAEAFSREAGTRNAAAGVNIRDSFLGQCWSDFWDSLDASYCGTKAETSAQGAARARARAQIRAQSQSLAEDRLLGPTIGQAWACLHERTDAHARAQVQAQAQTWALANDRALAYDSLTYGLGQTSVNHLPLYANIPMQPVVAPTLNNGQHGFQQGLGQESSRHNATRGSPQSRRRANRSGSQRRRNASHRS